MIWSRFRILLPLGVLAGAIASDASIAATCESAVADFKLAHESGDLDPLVAAYGRVAEPVAGCTERVIYCAGDSVARAYVEASYAAADKGASASEVHQLLSQGRAFGSPWQLLVGIADSRLAAAQAQKNPSDYQQAATAYQDALNVIGEDNACSDFGEPPRPTAAEIGPIYERMTEALLLAPEFDVVRTREGNCGGIFLASVRGFTPTYRPVPINFVFGQATFTREGEKAASTMLSCLKEEGYSEVVVSGHTDPIGSNAYNMELSKRRLETVAIYLREGGFAGHLTLVPKGESEPFQADDPTAYTADELNQLNRRVVLRDTK